MLNYLKTALKGATSLFIAILGVALVVWLFEISTDYYDKYKAIPYQTLKVWSYSVKDTLGIDVKAKTKVIDGTLYVVLEIVGYPKFFDYEINQENLIIVDFYDGDGFSLLSKDFKLRDFSKLIDKKGNNIGLEAQFEQSISIDTYKRFNKLKIGWNVIQQSDLSKLSDTDLITFGSVKAQGAKLAGVQNEYTGYSAELNNRCNAKEIYACKFLAGLMLKQDKQKTIYALSRACNLKDKSACLDIQRLNRHGYVDVLTP